MAIRMSPEELASLSRLWDAAQALPETQRLRWLEGLNGPDASLKGTLRQMLATRHEGSDAFMEILPTLRIEPEAATTPGAADACAPPPPALVGPYRVIRQLGAGGMGTVWMARHVGGSIDGPVALKLPHRELLGSRFLKDFAQEQRIVASLNHPFIARLYDAGVTDDGQPYMALEYVSGAPLIAHCHARRMAVRARLAVFQQVLEAVRYAHARGVVHRDLKPSNIVMSADGQAHLLDFGIAAVLSHPTADSIAMQTPAMPLTPSYASPEQIGGHAATLQGDVYSLGVMLYEMLCGQRPYRQGAGSRADLVRAVLDAPIHAPSTMCTAEQARLCGTIQEKLAATLSGDLDAIVATALAKNPADRYASAESFAMEIERYMDLTSSMPTARVHQHRTIRTIVGR